MEEGKGSKLGKPEKGPSAGRCNHLVTEYTVGAERGSC